MHIPKSIPKLVLVVLTGLWSNLFSTSLVLHFSLKSKKRTAILFLQMIVRRCNISDGPEACAIWCGGKAATILPQTSIIRKRLPKLWGKVLSWSKVSASILSQMLCNLIDFWERCVLLQYKWYYWLPVVTSWRDGFILLLQRTLSLIPDTLCFEVRLYVFLHHGLSINISMPLWNTIL